MEQKRTLLWLSANTHHDELSHAISDQWQLTRINPRQPPLTLQPAWMGKPVGVCQLDGLAAGEFEHLRQWLELLPASFWLALVHQSQLKQPQIRRLIQDYCQDYHTLPVDWQRLRNSLGHMWGMSSIRSADATVGRQNYQGFVLSGPSQIIRQTRSVLRRYAATNEPVLIYGESGTGREAAARFVHRDSSRSNKPLVYVNCAALPPSLTQSELFGHERGAFTHALKARKGRIESANGGTLVLAGADELTLEQQSALLRFLQEGQVEPIGANEPVSVDVRVVATSNQPLEQLVKQGEFRDDIYYRLGNLTVTLPPLRERLEDLPYLVQRTLELCTNPGYRIDNNALIAMIHHNWPGNLRELQNRINQAVLLAQSLRIQPEDLGLLANTAPTQPARFSLEAFRARADRDAIATSLSLTHHNISAAARLLDISRVSFYRLLEKHKLQPPLHPGNNRPVSQGGKGDAP